MQYRRWQQLEAKKQTNKQVNDVKEKMLKNCFIWGPYGTMAEQSILPWF